MELKIHSAEHDVQLLSLSGRMDTYTAKEVQDWLREASAAPPARVVVNMSGVYFVDSTALATLVQGMKRCRQRDGDLKLSNLQQPVRMIFELTRLDKAFEIYPEEADAVEAFAPVNMRLPAKSGDGNRDQRE